MAFIPDGVQDLLSAECERKQKVIDTLQKRYQSYGYAQIETPTFEYYDTLSEIKNTVDKDATLKIIDKDGKILVLRPDVTTPIARMSAAHYGDSLEYLKLRYTMQVFRTNKKDRRKEMTQVGIEYLGKKTPYSDGEVITLAIEGLLDCGVSAFQIDIGQTEYVKALLENIGRKKEIQRLLANKNFIGLSQAVEKLEVDEQRKKAIKKIPYLYGSIEQVLQNAYTGSEQARQALGQLEATYEMLCLQGYQQYLSFDLGMMQDLNYYTGIIFKGYMNDYGKPVLSGGRYDDLMQQYHKETSATGFGVYVDNLLEAMETGGVAIPTGGVSDYLVIGQDVEAVLTRSKQLRDRGGSVEYLIKDPKEVGDLRKGKNVVII